MSEAKRCCKQLFGTRFGYRGAPCSKKATAVRDGKWYCGIHDPEKVAERKKLQKEKWSAKAKINAERWRLQCAAPDLLAALQALVSQILDYERVNNLSPNPGRNYCWDNTERAVAAIAKATGERSPVANSPSNAEGVVP